MIVSKQEIKSTKESIEKYYRNIKFIRGQQQREKRLEDRLKSIHADRNSSHFSHSLSSDIKGITYDSILVDGGRLPASSMDQEIERIYVGLDREYEKTAAELMETKRLIRKAETENEKMGFYIALLQAEHKKTLELRYLENMGITKISFEIHIAKSTVCKYLNNIYKEVSKLILYYE